MTWVKVDDNALDDPRFLRLARGVRLLHIEALSWASRHGAAGAIPRSALTRLTDEPEPEAAVVSLVGAGLWAVTDEGWQLVWLQDDQPTPEMVEHTRARNRAKLARHRKHVIGDHSLCVAPYCKSAGKGGNPVGNPARNPVRNDSPSRPVPSQTGKGRDKDGDAAGLVEPAAAALRTGLEQRRAMAKAIREAPDNTLRRQHKRKFDRIWGALYERAVLS